MGGISYGYTFFTQNRKIASGSITTANLTINFSDRNISASNLSKPTTDQEGLYLYTKSLTMTNTTSTIMIIMGYQLDPSVTPVSDYPTPTPVPPTPPPVTPPSAP